MMTGSCSTNVECKEMWSSQRDTAVLANFPGLSTTLIVKPTEQNSESNESLPISPGRSQSAAPLDKPQSHRGIFLDARSYTIE